jgi:hydrogenase maturation protein HypF
MTTRLRVRVRGTVQGVGFRPHVWLLATGLGLTGTVRNDAEGVLAEVQGTRAAEFLERLRRDPPPLARISAIEAECRPPVAEEAGFVILGSAAGRVATAVAPDACVCADCLAEMCDPADRRWRFPFINCTNCGPRFTITRHLPYDRANTAMAGFPLCEACRREYEDPADRRFHAEPTACPACGPGLSHELSEVLAALRGGRIVALKGLGGFHLLCDAGNDAAVARLRARKERGDKPFAVMALNGLSAQRWLRIGAVERRTLESVERPVVLVRKQGQGLCPWTPPRGSGPLEPISLAPGLDTLGLMLPAAPLHFLLFHEAAGRPAGTFWLEQPNDLLLVATSANPGGEPLVIDDDDARARLAGLADLVVTHDRPVVTRCDDSVVRVIDGGPRFLRRARGFTPRAIALPQAVPPVLALGGLLKATACATRGNEAVLSQHVGTLDNVATLRFLDEAVRHLLHLLDTRPVLLAHDLHPDFPARRLAGRLGLPMFAVQHHHAHAAAVLAEHGVTAPALAVVLDGFGLGGDGEAWGGELLRLDGAIFRRLGHLRKLALPGGDAAARQPWRMGAAALHALGRGEEIVARFGPQAAPVARLLAAGRVAATSSCGRLFDAAAALLGVLQTSTYEGEGAMRLEALATAPRVLAGGWRLNGMELDLLPLLEALRKCTAEEGAGLFHGTLAAGIVAWVVAASGQEGLDTVALGGGCFVNRVLAEAVAGGLRNAGLRPLLPLQAPAGDGGLSLGQAWIAALGAG